MTLLEKMLEVNAPRAGPVGVMRPSFICVISGLTRAPAGRNPDA
ncbi:hypothetical protein [Streptomyces sp. NPDC049916]